MTAEQLRAARVELDLTQVELAEQLGVDERTVKRWEAEDRGIPSLLERRAALTTLRLHDALDKMKVAAASKR